MRTTITDLIGAIPPWDSNERRHIADALAWIATCLPLCRIAKPDVPPKHLVSYFLVVDPDRRRLLLVDHRNAGLWLPNGGHVEPGEHPADTVRREIVEELAIEAMFLRSEPIFLTVTETVGTTAGHVDEPLFLDLLEVPKDIAPSPAKSYLPCGHHDDHQWLAVRTQGPIMS